MVFRESFSIRENKSLRVPQREGWQQLVEHFKDDPDERSVGLVLPVGCGKSGLIALAPYALGLVLGCRRVLVIAPGTRIRDQLANDMKSSSEHNFYEKCSVLDSQASFPETTVIASGAVNHDDIAHSDIVVANIQQVAGEENRWLDELEKDFFDLILIDEGHRNVSMSWQQVLDRFPSAKIVNFSATPTRADGRVMEGKIIYSYPVVQAIDSGYVKRLSAKMLRPSELTYIDRTSGSEKTISLDEVISLGETNAEFRRGIVMSEPTLSTIVDCSIGELRRLRSETGENRLKIIASALNIDHCIQIVEAFRARGLRADYVHSRREGQAANDRVLEKLNNHEIDVIVQARMLSEGFDHKYLAVAMVGSIFGNLSPFIQFVGRVMRTIEQNAPGSLLNRGVVVFHAGANIAQRWEDFRYFSKADREYFAHLLPEAEAVTFDQNGTAESAPYGNGLGAIQPVDVVSEAGTSVTDMAPIGDSEIEAVLQDLLDRGATPDQISAGIRRIRPTRQDERHAKRRALNEHIQNAVGRVLGRCGINPGGKTLDKTHRNTNFQWAISNLNQRVNASVSEEDERRDRFSLDQLESALNSLDSHVKALELDLTNV